MSKRLSVVVRCKDEMPYAERTFQALARSNVHVIVVDSGSKDGSREAASSAGFDVIDIVPSAYVPGRVLNDAMRRTDGDVVVFVNADAVPMTPHAVELLAEACRKGAAASYGRQVPRGNARTTTRRDLARAYPEDARGPRIGHFFSMAASAIRRDLWQVVPFDEDLRFSEDVDWTWRVRALGREVRYVPEAHFEHSHDYSMRSLWRRMHGEGEADGLIYRMGPPGLGRQFVVPLLGALARDARDGALWPRTFAERITAQTARIRGRARSWSRPRWIPKRPEPVACDAGFTLDGRPEAERFVADVIEQAAGLIARGLGSDLEALLLIGGYAAGEGSVEWKNGRPAIHNDLDLVAVVSTAQRARSLRARCAALSEEVSREVGCTVDVFPIPRQELQQPLGKLLWVDAATRGVRVVHGNREVVEPLRSLSARRVVSDEVGRLLMNRAVGLALSRLEFAAGREERTRAARHVAKAWLACGDALLIYLDQYGATADRRVAALEAIADVGAPWVAGLATGYAEAMAFRRGLSGAGIEGERLESACASIWPCFATLESYRLGEPIAALPQQYAMRRERRFRQLVDVSGAGKVVGGPGALLRRSVGWRQALYYPRDTLARAASLLAFGNLDDDTLRQARKLLGARDSSPHAVHQSLQRLTEVCA